MHVQSLQSCPTLCDPTRGHIAHSPPGPSVHGSFPASMLEWVSISYSRSSSWPRDWTCLLHCRWILYREPWGKPRWVWPYSKCITRTSPLVQWLRIHLSGNRGLIPGLGRFHLPLGNEARVPQLLTALCSAKGEARTVRSLRTTSREQPRSPQPEKARTQQQRPSAAVSKQTEIWK